MKDFFDKWATRKQHCRTRIFPLYAKSDCLSAFSRLPTYQLADFPWVQQSSYELVDFQFVKRRRIHVRVYDKMLVLFDGKEPEDPTTEDGQPRQKIALVPTVGWGAFTICPQVGKSAAYFRNQRLSCGSIWELLKEYTSNRSNPAWKCLASELIYTNWNKRLSLDYKHHKWTIRGTGELCDGVESWEIDDHTGAIQYLGSSTAP